MNEFMKNFSLEGKIAFVTGAPLMIPSFQGMVASSAMRFFSASSSTAT